MDKAASFAQIVTIAQSPIFAKSVDMEGMLRDFAKLHGIEDWLKQDEMTQLYDLLEEASGQPKA